MSREREQIETAPTGTFGSWKEETAKAMEGPLAELVLFRDPAEWQKESLSSLVLEFYSKRVLESHLKQLAETNFELFSSYIIAPINEIKSSIKEIRQDIEILFGLFREKAQPVFIQNLRNPAYKLTQPIPITIEYDGEQHIASYDDVELFGSGEFREDAITELCVALIDYYETLVENRDRLGPLPQQHWDFLRNLISQIE
jgi:hypothetical protein